MVHVHSVLDVCIHNTSSSICVLLHVHVDGDVLNHPARLRDKDRERERVCVISMWIEHTA